MRTSNRSRTTKPRIVAVAPARVLLLSHLCGVHAVQASYVSSSFRPRVTFHPRNEFSLVCGQDKRVVPKRNMQLFGSNEYDNDDEKKDEKGSVFGASLLFAGTAIGAGMLALPAETAAAGFVPSESSLLLCWVFTYVTSLVTLEASWSVGRGRHANLDSTGSIDMKDQEQQQHQQLQLPERAGFLSIAKMTLGPVGEGATILLFWFLLTSIIVAYTSEGRDMLVRAVQEQGLIDGGSSGGGGSSMGVPPVLYSGLGSAFFVLFFASLAIFGTKRVDVVNRLLMTGLVGSFVGLVGIALPQISTDLLWRADWSAIYPAGVSVGILSFGAQNVVPTLLQYLGGDAVRTQRAILVGSLIPLVVYSLWEGVFLGIVPWYASDGGSSSSSSGGGIDGITVAVVAAGYENGSKIQIVKALGETSGGTIVPKLVELFSACAIGSSMAGASVSLVDFFQDAITSEFVAFSSTIADDDGGSDGETDRTTFAAKKEQGLVLPIINLRVVSVTLALGPPLVVACAYPGVFLGALENAGLIGGVSLYGLLPALSVIRLRNGLDGFLDDHPKNGVGSDGTSSLVATSYSRVCSSGERNKNNDMPGRLVGGTSALYCIAIVSTAVVLPEFVRLSGNIVAII